MAEYSNQFIPLVIGRVRAANQEVIRIGGHIRADTHCDPNIPF
jgi:hypothetical protein